MTKVAADKVKEPSTTKKKVNQTISSSSTAEYFSKNLQQVGFSSPTKAILTTLKEAVDNSLDACEEEGILPEIIVEVEKLGPGTLKNTDQISVTVEDNGPGIDPEDVGKVFGEYLASSKFGRGRCSRGQQGIGISAATTWAQQTSARGVEVTTKTKSMKKGFKGTIEVNFKLNKGVIKDKETIDWNKPHGTKVKFIMDGRIQLQGEAGLLSYIRGTILVNPHLKISCKLPDTEPMKIDRVSDVVPDIPDATNPHPHTMKLGDFHSHAKLFGKMTLAKWLKTGFSRMGEQTIQEMCTKGVPKAWAQKPIDGFSEEELKKIYTVIQNMELRAPSTSSVISIGEEAIAKSIKRLGDTDFFSVLSRKPAICDYKPVLVEVAIARFLDQPQDADEPVQVLRFANRVPLQFDKASCAIVKAITSVNWKTYGLRQPKDALPQGGYIIAVSVVSPFIKFKNASKETIDASDELVEELRRALMQAGQKLSRYLKREFKESELEQKIQHIEQFGPILVEGLCRIVGASDARKQKASEGLMKILGRDTKTAEQELETAKTKEEVLKAKEAYLQTSEPSVEEKPNEEIEITKKVKEKTKAKPKGKKKK